MATNPQNTTQAQPKPQQQQVPAVKPLRILVAEDENELRTLYVQVLQKAGYAVDQAIDGEEATKAMSSNSYDLVFLDVMMPKINGPEVLHILKEQVAATPNNRVIVLTNIANDSVKDFCLEEGARGYLIKTDITPDKLIATAQAFFQEAKSGKKA